MFIMYTHTHVRTRFGLIACARGTSVVGHVIIKNENILYTYILTFVYINL